MSVFGYTLNSVNVYLYTSVKKNDPHCMSSTTTPNYQELSTNPLLSSTILCHLSILFLYLPPSSIYHSFRSHGMHMRMRNTLHNLEFMSSNILAVIF